MNELIEEQLHAIARGRIASGRLPCVTHSRTWGGKGTGRPCALCDRLIQPPQIEYEVETTTDGGTITLFFHRVCQSIWQIECTQAQLEEAP
jgi:hypothetical protein